MTDKQNNPDPIAHAARLLRETAEELRQEYTLSSDRNNWRGDCVAKAAYDEHMAAAQALEDWEAAVGAGGVQPLRSVQEGCKLVPLEPTQEMLAALMSPGEAEVLASSPSETFALMLMDRAGIRERYSAMLAASPTPPAEQQATTEAATPKGDATTGAALGGGVYAELPKPSLPRGGFPDLFTERQMRDFADRTHALRMQAAPKAAPPLPEGWTDCTIEFGNDGPEVVAYGPKRMMNRLAKWLGKYFAQVIADAAPKAAPVVWLSSKQLRGVTALHGQYLPFRCQPEGRFDTPVYLVEATPRAAPQQEAPKAAPGVPRLTRQDDALCGYLADCDDNAITPDVAGAFAWAWAHASVAAPQPAPAPLSDDAKDAARWRWLSEHIGAAWNEGKFTSLVRIVSDKNRAALNASIDRMMTGDWSDAALAAHGGR